MYKGAFPPSIGITHGATIADLIGVTGIAH